MASLYEIDSEYVAAMVAAEDYAAENGGEISAELYERLDAIEADRAAKIEAVASYILNLRSDADALSAEAKRLKDRANAAARRAEWLEQYLSAHAPAGAYGLRQVSYRRSEAVELSGDVLCLPFEYRRTKITDEADKAAIKEAIKSGKVIDGAVLVERKTISIK